MPTIIDKVSGTGYRRYTLKRTNALQARLTDIDSTLAEFSNHEQRLKASKVPCRPFVKWAGGKTQLVERMRTHFPETFNRYYEPFLGGAAVFFYLVYMREKPFPATLSDINHDLINAYLTVKTNLKELIEILAIKQREFRALTTKTKQANYYQNIRSNRPDIEKESVERAAWFIFLNKTSYNGLYRVNSKGEFNVPYGDYPNATLYEEGNLERISSILNRGDVEILWQDYRSVLLDNAQKGDFCYLDPPYYSKDNKGFTAYNASLFTADDQRKLAETYKVLTERGVTVLLSNSESDFIRGLFNEKEKQVKGGRKYSYDSFEALRVINCKGSKRTGAKELLIKNY